MIRAKNCVVFYSLALTAFCLAVRAQSPAPPSTASQQLSLDGEWRFVIDPAGSLKVGDLASAASVQIRVPGSWQSQRADLRDYAGVAWYWRAVNVDALKPGEVAVVHFGAVDYRAEVYVNGQKAGVHDGGYLPFEFDVTSLLRAGENQIAIRVVDPGLKPSAVEGIRYAEIPHGKQNWYVQTSGLWQSVALRIQPQTRLGVAHVTAGADGKFSVHTEVVNPPPVGAQTTSVTVEAQMLDPSGKLVWQEKQNMEPNQKVGAFSGSLPNPKLWSPSDPALYTLRMRTSTGDEQSCRFGFRTFETRDGKFYLNGKVIYLRGALDQAFYPETIYTPPSLDFLKNEMREAKALGLNLLRCHIKVPDPRYLEAADETGMLVWYEIPNWDKLTADSESRALATLRGMVRRDWNHASIVIVSLVNESWGVNLKEAADRAWLKDLFSQAKQLAPGWLVDDNSACCDNFHLATDLADFHQYNSIPGHAADFDRFVGDLATRPRWLFSPYGDAAPKGDEPLVLSEFGNWGLPFLPQIRPWWFTRDFNGREITLPAGVEKRFEDYQYSSLFPDLHALAAATQQHEFNSLRSEITSLRSHGSIQGYVITEFTDVMWESNGLLDLWRHPKNFQTPLAAIQQDDGVFIRAGQHNFFSGSTAAADVYVSHYSQEDLSGAKVVWSVEGTPLQGNFDVPAIPAGTAAKVGTVGFTVPAIPAPVQRVLSVQLVVESVTVAKNSIDVFFYPVEKPDLPPPISFHDPKGELRRLENDMQARDYVEASGTESRPVLIASAFDDVVKKVLLSGGRVILLADSKQTVAPGLDVVTRSSGNLNGDWISNFSWIRKDKAPFKQIGFRALQGFESEAVTPAAVIQGIPPSRFQDVLAGDFYGWIHSNVGTLVQARYGPGKLLICTFSLATTYGADPYATYLLDALVNYAVSDFTPAFQILAETPY